MSSQEGFVTKNGYLSAKALKRIFKDGVVPKKSAKKQRVIEAEPDEVYEEPLKEIPDLGFPKTSEKESEKRRCLKEAVKTI
jgi:hypothetical protein